MENLIRVDFGTNRVESTREEWIQELIHIQIESLDSIDNNDSMIAHLLKKGFIGYANMSDEQLIDEIYDWLAHQYDIEETL
jgi:bifunctional pyridoxal-dependent enzyme with beta-cystathionase and maltose regulon repressor activities